MVAGTTVHGRSRLHLGPVIHRPEPERPCDRLARRLHARRRHAQAISGRREGPVKLSGNTLPY